MRKLLFTTAVVLSLFLLSNCTRTKCDCAPPLEKGNKLSYGDSLLYLKNNDYAVAPVTNRTGTYSAYPDNLTIDRRTGAITVTAKGTDGESQTGMWYKISFRSDAGEADSTFILLSGITYLDRFYHLSQNDSIIYPIYNGDPSKPLPQGNYDLTTDNKFAVNAANGQININECKRRGFFGGAQANSSWKMATVKYAVNDKSGGAANKVDLVIYYYKTLSDVPRNVSLVMQAHQQMTLGMRNLPSIPSTTGADDNNLPSNLSLSKPRPPCVIIVGN
ncbi:MAG TPA: hypothetical protein VF609_16780 [Flavisolibacter sp.]|jgi:hypothetical protein